MTIPSSSPRAPSWRRVAAVALLRARRLVRTRRLVLAALMALLPWFAVEAADLLPRIAALTEFTVVGVTILAAGTLADDLEGGQYAIALTHDCPPLEVLLGEMTATLVLSLCVVSLGLPFVLSGESGAHLGTLLLCLAWLVALVAGWICMMLLLATFLPGVGNGIAMIALLIALPVLGSTLIDRLPSQLATAARIALQLVPAPSQLAPIYEAVILGAPAPRFASLVLLAAPFGWFALAVSRLARIEPAGRIAA